MSATIDLNADMGEYGDATAAANETSLMPLITSCSIACGGHAGDQETMRATIRLAKQHKVNIGAHPSYRDRENFGRRSMTMAPAALFKSLQSQLNALKIVLKEEGARLNHIKPHGALYNDAAQDDALAELVVGVASGIDLVGQPGSALERAARKNNVTFIAEGFVDRLYLSSGALTPRSMPGAVIKSIEQRALQAGQLASGAPIAAADGEVSLSVKTLCIHSDSPGAVETAIAVRRQLENDNVQIKAF